MPDRIIGEGLLRLELVKEHIAVAKQYARARCAGGAARNDRTRTRRRLEFDR